MRMLLKNAVIALALGGTALAAAGTAGAHGIYAGSDNNRGYYEDRGHTNSAISFGIGDVAVGYRDGYWDNRHSWHHWRNNRDYRDYRGNGHNYHNWNHYGRRGYTNGAISFGFGDVAFGYRDGYWDNRHSWHHWRNNRDYRNYRDNGDNYHNWDHDRDGDNGWRRHY